MKEFIRDYPLFSVCGLNCGLCTMHIGGHCPGCGGGAGNQICAIARCSKVHMVSYCCECAEYPCAKYDGIDNYDSFITHLHQKRDLDKLRHIGFDAYKTELEEKIGMLQVLLAQYNDGRHKSPFCTAVNLLEADSLREILASLSAEAAAEMPLKEKAKLAMTKLDAAAKIRGISLKLRKKK